MRLTLIDHHSRTRRPAPPAKRPLRLAGEAIEAVVIDERRRPVERVPGATSLKVLGDTAVLKVDLPLLPGSRLLLRTGARSDADAGGRPLELEIVACKKRQRGHHVVARIVEESSLVGRRKAA